MQRMDVRFIGDTPSGSVEGLSLYNSVSGGSNIKSIQRGFTALDGSTTSKTVTILAVDTTKAIIKVYYYNAGAAAVYTAIQAIISSATSFSLIRGDINGSTCSIYWEVIEFNNVKSLQKGTYGGFGTISITSVNLSKSFIIASWYANAYATSLFQGYGLTAANQITIAQSGTDGAIYHAWQVIEFN